MPSLHSKRSSITCPIGFSRSWDMPLRAFIVLGVTYAVSLTRSFGTGPCPSVSHFLFCLGIQL